MVNRSRTPLVIAAVVVVVALAGLLAVVLTRSSDDGGSTSPSTTEDAGGGGEAIVYGAIEVTGEPLPELTDPANDPAVGMAAPTIVGTDYAGQPLSITPGQDGPLMVIFLAHWCPVCNAEIPVLNAWRDSGAIPEDLKVVGVSTAVNEERPNFPPSQWLADRAWTWPALADDQAASALAAYGGTGFPFFVLIGEDGTVRARNAGQLPVEVLDALVATALA